MKEEMYLRIEAYLGGEMSQAESLAFEAEMESSPELKEEVALFKSINHHLHGNSEVDSIPNSEFAKKTLEFVGSNEANEIKDQLRAAQKEYRHTKRRPISYIGIAAAIAIIAIAGAVFYFSEFSQSPRELYVQYYRASDLPSLVKRGEGDGLVEKISIDFKAGKYDDVLAAFATYEKSTAMLDTSLFLYKGMAHFHLAQREEAIESFDLVASSQLIDYSKGLWFKAMTFLWANDEKSTREVLEVILSNPDHFRFEDARKLMDELR